MFLNGLKARTIYQLGPEPTNSEQYRIWNIQRMAPVETSLNGSASFWFNSRSETDKQD